MSETRCGRCVLSSLFIVQILLLCVAVRAGDALKLDELLAFWVRDNRFINALDYCAPTAEQQWAHAENLERSGQQLRAARAYARLAGCFAECDLAEQSLLRAAEMFSALREQRAALQLMREIRRRYAAPQTETALLRAELTVAGRLLQGDGDAAAITPGMRVGEARALLRQIEVDDAFGPWGTQIAALHQQANTLAAGLKPGDERRIPSQVRSTLQPLIASGRDLTLDEALYYTRIRELSKETRIDPKAARPFEEIGVLFLAKGNAGLARELFIKAAELEENRAESHYGMGFVALNIEQPRSALDHLTRAIELKTLRADAPFLRAQALEETGGVVQAIADYQAVYARDPAHVQARLAQARCHARMGQWAEAATACETALRIANENEAAGLDSLDGVSARFNLALIRWAQNQPREVLQILVPLEETTTAAADALLLKLRLATEMNDTDTAKAAFARLRQRRPEVIPVSALPVDKLKFPAGTKLQGEVQFPARTVTAGDILQIAAVLAPAEATLPVTAIVKAELTFADGVQKNPASESTMLIPASTGRFVGAVRVPATAFAGPCSIRVFVVGMEQEIAPIVHETGFQVVVPTALPVQVMDIEGLVHTSEQEVRRLMGSRKGRGYDPKLVAEDLARLRQKFPDAQIEELIWLGGVRLKVQINEPAESKAKAAPEKKSAQDF